MKNVINRALAAKKRFIAILLAIVASVGTMFAESGTCGDNLTWDLTNGVLTISGTGAMDDWSSSSEVPWYSYRSSIKEVSIGNSVTSIGEYAFCGCSGLTSVTIGNSVTSIGEGAFYECTGLTSVTIPNSVTSIGYWTFYNCTGLTSVTIPNSVTSIAYGAFYECTGLTSVTIPNSVTYIEDSAFEGCTGLTSITIPSSVTYIGGVAFGGCTGLTSIVVASGNTEYDSRNNCNAIIETSSNTLIAGCKNTIIPNSVTSIGQAAFYDCTSLTSVTIPNSVTSIGNKAFTYCSGLTSITIPNSVTSIGSYAFDGCSGLTSITIPNSVTSIGYAAFEGCTGLTSITCEAVEPPACGSDVFSDVPKTIPLYVPAGSVDKYKAADQWKDFGENILPISTIAIESVQYSEFGSQKIMHDGQIFLRRGDKIYTVTGAEIQ